MSIAFDVKYPTSVDEAVAFLKEGNAAPLSGGTDLISTYKSRCTPNTADVIVDLKKIPGLSYIKEDGNFLKIGAMTTLTEIANNDLVKKSYAALAQAAGVVASPELRNMGTIAGNICQKVRCWYYRGEDNLFPCARKVKGGSCYAITGDNRYHSIFGGVSGCFAVSPSDIAPVLVAFDATIVTTKKSYTTSEFFKVNGEKQVAIADDEIVTEIQIPKAGANTKSCYKKYALRKAFDFPIVGAAVVAEMSGNTVSSSRVALGAVYNTPRLAEKAADAIKGKAVNEANAEAAGLAAVTGATAMPYNKTTTTVSNVYIIQLAKVMVKRAFLNLA